MLDLIIFTKILDKNRIIWYIYSGKRKKSKDAEPFEVPESLEPGSPKSGEVGTMKEPMKGRLITEQLIKSESPREEEKALRKTGKKIFLPVFLFIFILLNSSAFSDDQQSQQSVTPTIIDDTTIIQTATATETPILSNTPTATLTSTPQFIITITNDKSGSAALGDTVHFTIYYSLIGTYYIPNAYLNIYTINNAANKSGYLIGTPVPTPLDIFNVQQPYIAWNVGPPDTLINNINGQLDFYYKITSTANANYQFYAYWNDGKTHGGAYSPNLVIITQTTTPTCTSTDIESPTPTSSISGTLTGTPTNTPTWTLTDSETSTHTPSVTATVTPTNILTEALTFTATQTNTPTWTLTDSETLTYTASATTTATPTNTLTEAPTFTATQTNTPTWTLTDSETPTYTVSATTTAATTNTLTEVPTFTATQTNTPIWTLTGSPSFTITDTVSATATKIAIFTPTITPVNTEQPNLCLIAKYIDENDKRKENGVNGQIILTNCSKKDIDLSRVSLRYCCDSGNYPGEEITVSIKGIKSNRISENNDWGNIKKRNDKKFEFKDKDEDSIKECIKTSIAKINSNTEMFEIIFKQCAGEIKQGEEITLIVFMEIKGDNMHGQPSGHPVAGCNSCKGQEKISIYVDGYPIQDEEPTYATPTCIVTHACIATPVRELLKESEVINKTMPEAILTQPDEKNVYNYPNPCNGTTTIRFPLTEPQNVMITISDASGRMVWEKELTSFDTTACINHIKWQGVNDTGREVSNGVYILKLILKDRVITKKIAVIR